MPDYAFECEKCGHKFDIIESVSEHDKREETCPKCESQDLQHILGPVLVQTSKKS